MGDAASLVKRDFVRGDVEASVDLHFVGVDDLGMEAGGEFDGELGFSGAGGPHDDDDILFLSVSTGGVNRRIYGGRVHARPARSKVFGDREKRGGNDPLRITTVGYRGWKGNRCHRGANKGQYW